MVNIRRGRLALNVEAVPTSTTMNRSPFRKNSARPFRAQTGLARAGELPHETVES
jgi:hypothetical protein